MYHRTIILSLTLILTLSITACRDTPEIEAGKGENKVTISIESPLYGIYQLCKSSGNPTEIQGASTLKPFDVDGVALDVAGRQLDLYAFDSKEDASEAVSGISPDGMLINGKAQSWKSDPHFFRTDRVIIMYIGNDSDMVSLVTQMLGNQIAGK